MCGYISQYSNKNCNKIILDNIIKMNYYIYKYI